MTPQAQPKYLKDYQAPQFAIEQVFLTFDLDEQRTRVTNRMQMRRCGESKRLTLMGEGLSLLNVKLQGRLLTAQEYQLSETELSLDVQQDTFELEIETQLNPADNTFLEGLYCSGGNFCTQCEAEGFRRMTYFLDRPDVLSIYTTKVIADKARYPVLLANGNNIEQGDMELGRHYAVWHDPYPKPSYLFALVAGDLSCMQDEYVTAEGRHVALQIYTDAHHIPRCRHAMDSLKQAMSWDEQRFGRCYDLDIYMIVAVDDFNMGAMENKGLNIFNSKYVLADSATATDVDFEGVEAVIAHEYFHNWTGNRITCRDWFQLTLKEGLTVFRDQAFTSDRLSAAVKRIEDVRRLRSVQFAEDAGPMRHPIQPQSYIEMNNFYTMTVYEKGAEVVRLYHTLLGEEGFRRGMDLYFERHDGQAVTVEDFRNAMADANQVDLAQMQAWYTQAGTPRLKVRYQYSERDQALTIHCEQSLPGQDDFEPFLIPLKLGLLDPEGQPIALQDTQIEPVAMPCQGDSVVLWMREAQQSFRVMQLPSPPQVSMLRDFSAPVILDDDEDGARQLFLAKYDTNAFNRWEAVQRLALADLKFNVAQPINEPYQLSAEYTDVFQRLLEHAQDQHADTDLALLAYALMRPDINYLIEQYAQLDIDSVLLRHQQLQQTLADKFAPQLQAIYVQQHRPDQTYEYERSQIAARLLKNFCLDYLLACQKDSFAHLAVAQYQAQSNMTDVMAALKAMMPYSDGDVQPCLDDFYQRWQGESLVIDKWFALQAATSPDQGLGRVKALVEHADFCYTNPNRVRSVVGVFGRMNLQALHQADGQGYQWLAQQVARLDQTNPQVAARMITPLTQWKKYDAQRQDLMLAQLKWLESQVTSKDAYEILSKTLESI